MRAGRCDTRFCHGRSGLLNEFPRRHSLQVRDGDGLIIFVFWRRSGVFFFFWLRLGYLVG